MKVAITGGTGFVGRHLARSLASDGHHVVLIARGVDRRDESVRGLPLTTMVAAGVRDEEALVRAFSGCDAVAHCAGINREIGDQTYQRVHVEGTRAVVQAAQRAGVRKLALLSFLRARPDCGMSYHESKWAAEEMVRNSSLDYTIVKPGVVYGPGDHLLDHLSHALFTFPVFALIGRQDRLVAPLAVQDLVRVLKSALVEGGLARQTISVVGPEQITFKELVRRVATVAGRKTHFVRLPVWFHLMLANLFERVMKIPLVSLVQVHMLAEGMTEPEPPCASSPLPECRFTEARIASGLPPPGGFTLRDLRGFRQAKGAGS